MALTKTFSLDGDSGYGFEWLRLLTELTLQEGVFRHNGPNDFRVSAAGAGGNRVDVAAGVAAVKGDTGLAQLGLTQGLYLQVNDAALPNAATLDPGDANPRLDQIVLEVNDPTDLSTAGSTPRIYALKGANTAGATLDNRAGAAALPANTLRLADVLVPAGSNATSAGNIRDRRPWAAGAEFYASRSTAGVYTGPLGSFFGGSRLELGTALVQILLETDIENNTAGQTTNVYYSLDGNFYEARVKYHAVANTREHVTAHWVSGPAIGSHTFDVGFQPSGGQLTVRADTAPTRMLVREYLRPNAANN